MKFKNFAIEMIKQGISREELTQKLNENGVEVTYSTVCRWIRGTSEPNFGQAGVIAKILDSTIDYLFETEEI